MVVVSEEVELFVLVVVVDVVEVVVDKVVDIVVVNYQTFSKYMIYRTYNI